MQEYSVEGSCLMDILQTANVESNTNLEALADRYHPLF